MFLRLFLFTISCPFSFIANAGLSISLENQQHHLLVAIKSGDQDFIQEFLYNNAWQETLDEPDSEGLTALHHAIINHDYRSANMLLGYGANPNQTISGVSLLEYIWRQELPSSRENDEWQKLLFLLIERVDYYHVFSFARDFFDSVLTNNSAKVAHAIIERAPLELINHARYLKKSIKFCPSAALLLIDKGVSLNWHYKGKTPLHYAVSWNQDRIIEKLIENGLDVHARDHKKRTPIARARTDISLETLKLFIGKHADIRALCHFEFLIKIEFELAHLIIIHGMNLTTEIQDFMGNITDFIAYRDHYIEIEDIKKIVLSNRKTLISAIDAHKIELLESSLQDENIALCVDARVKGKTPIDIAEDAHGLESAITLLLKSHSLRYKSPIKTARR